MERDCESELSKLNIEQNACIYHFGASVIHGQRSNILRLQSMSNPNMVSDCIRKNPRSFRCEDFFWLFVKSWGNLFLRHRNIAPVSLYVRDRKIRFLKFSKFRYPKAFRLITLMALCKFRMNGTPVTLQRCEGFASSVRQAFTPAY